MTKTQYDPTRLDELALQALDVAGRLRQMAARSRAEQLPAVDLNDRKAQEWLAKLAAWLDRCEHDFELALVQNRGRLAAEKAKIRHGKKIPAGR